MKKAIALIKGNSLLETYSDRFHENAIRANEAMEFIKKRAADIEKNFNETKDRLWEELERELLERGMYPEDYDPDKHGLALDRTEGVLYMMDKDHEEMPDFLKKLLGKTE